MLGLEHAPALGHEDAARAPRRATRSEGVQSDLAIYIGRGSSGASGMARSFWCNPFPMEGEASREACVAMFEHYARSRGRLRRAARRLCGRALHCHCPLGHRCHGDVLAALAVGPSDEEDTAQQGPSMPRRGRRMATAPVRPWGRYRLWAWGSPRSVLSVGRATGRETRHPGSPRPRGGTPGRRCTHRGCLPRPVPARRAAGTPAPPSPLRGCPLRGSLLLRPPPGPIAQ